MLCLGSFLIYKSIYINPREWYDHYLHLARSISEFRADTPNLPEYYQDKIIVNNKTYIPFPIGPALLIIPFLVFEYSQQQISVIVSSINVGLLFLVLQKYKQGLKKSVLLALFFGLGTPAFWSAIVGTTWYFGHNSAIFYLLISILILNKIRSLSLVSGVFFSLSALSRLPILGLLPFMIILGKQKRSINVVFFLLGSVVFFLTTAFYNQVRFGSPIETGYDQVYMSYQTSNIPYSLQRVWFNKNADLNYFDIKAIPYHIYTFIFQPPENQKPSPYGMGILFSSPFIFIYFLSKHLSKKQLTLLVSSSFTALIVFMHYAQGWVQFGYRFLLDLIIPVLLIISFKFKFNFINLVLIIVSIVVNFWGVSWAIELGW